jgi:hypothetical protein
MKKALFNNRGEGHIDTGVKIIIAVVIGALILGGIYLLFAGDDGIMNNLNNEVEGMMDYTQELRYQRSYVEESNTYILQYSYDGKHWHDSTVPTISETATVYGVMSNNSDSDPIEVALMQDGSQYYVLTSTDGGINWTQAYSFQAANGITHFYYGTDSRLPSTSGSFTGEKFVIRYWVGGRTYYTMVSTGLTWQAGWSDLIRI